MKVKLSFHKMQAYKGSGGKAPCILDGGEWLSPSFLCFPSRESSHYPFYRRLNGRFDVL
jgi:hypothetical protein